MNQCKHCKRCLDLQNYLADPNYRCVKCSLRMLDDERVSSTACEKPRLDPTNLSADFVFKVLFGWVSILVLAMFLMDWV